MIPTVWFADSGSLTADDEGSPSIDDEDAASFTVGDLSTWTYNDQFRYDKQPVQRAILRVNLHLYEAGSPLLYERTMEVNITAKPWSGHVDKYFPWAKMRKISRLSLPGCIRGEAATNSRPAVAYLWIPRFQ